MTTFNRIYTKLFFSIVVVIYTIRIIGNVFPSILTLYPWFSFMTGSYLKPSSMTTLLVNIFILSLSLWIVGKESD